GVSLSLLLSAVAALGGTAAAILLHRLAVRRSAEAAEARWRRWLYDLDSFNLRWKAVGLPRAVATVLWAARSRALLALEGAMPEQKKRVLPSPTRVAELVDDRTEDEAELSAHLGPPEGGD